MTKDFLNGGTTSTAGSVASIAPDNAPSPHGDFGDPDNMAANGTLTTVDWTDAAHRLDVGYHYGASEQHVGEAHVYTTLRHPKERVEDPAEGVSPSVTKPYHLALAAGKDGGGDDVTVSVFVTDDSLKMGYRVFRGGEMEMGTIDVADGPEGRAVAAAASPGGTVFAAHAAWSNSTVFVSPHTFYVQGRRIDVFRQESDGSWRKIADFSPTLDTYSDPADRLAWPRVALAPAGDDLYVFWTNEDPAYAAPPATFPQAQIWGAYLSDATNPNLYQTPTDLATCGGRIADIQFPYANGYIAQWETWTDLQAEWDDAIPDGDDGTFAAPRIVLTDERTGSSTQPELYAARVTLNQDAVPTGLSNQTALSINGKSSALSMRRSESRFSIDSTSDRAFCRFFYTGSSTVQRYNLSNPSTTDSWSHVGTDISSASQPAVTSRSFGTDRLFYVKSSALVDDGIGAFTQAIGAPTWPKLDAWKTKPENTFLTHRGADAGIIDVYQILP